MPPSYSSFSRMVHNRPRNWSLAAMATLANETLAMEDTTTTAAAAAVAKKKKKDRHKTAAAPELVNLVQVDDYPLLEGSALVHIALQSHKPTLGCTVEESLAGSVESVDEHQQNDE